ncbi:MAG: sugar transferase, partial [Blastocatellia bacterium]
MRKAVLTIGETLSFCAAGVAGAYIRFSSRAGWELIHHQGWIRVLLLALLVQLSFYIFDLYDIRSMHQSRLVIQNLARAFAAAAIVLTAIYYILPALVLGRGVFLIDLVIVFVIASSSRLLLASYLSNPKVGARERVLILGSGKVAVNVARETLERPGAGYFVVGFVDDKPELLGKSLINPSVIGLSDKLEEVVKNNRVERIVVAVEDRRGNFPTDELLRLRLSGQVAVEESARFYERLTGKIAIEMLRPSWLIFSPGERLSEFKQRLTRVINVAFAAAGLVLALPVMVVLSIVILVDSGGPILYLQERIGQNDRVFKIIKFRSMRVGAERKSGPVWASQSDPRATRIGRIIRKLRLDELPQFINVLRGDMNFVGPRPERPEFVKQLSSIIPY